MISPFSSHRQKQTVKWIICLRARSQEGQLSLRAHLNVRHLFRRACTDLPVAMSLGWPVTSQWLAALWRSTDSRPGRSSGSLGPSPVYPKGSSRNNPVSQWPGEFRCQQAGLQFGAGGAKMRSHQGDECTKGSRNGNR